MKHVECLEACSLLQAVIGRRSRRFAPGMTLDGGPFCPRYYRDMQEAVLAFVDYKYAAGRGTFRNGGKRTAWRDGEAVQSEIPRYSEEAVAATEAYCKYVYERYGRFPLTGGPFRTVLAYQAHRLNPDFYTRVYKPGALPETHGDGRE